MVEKENLLRSHSQEETQVEDQLSQSGVSGITAPDMSDSEKRIVAATITGLAKVQRTSPANVGTIVSGTGSAIAGRAATMAATRSIQQLQADDISQVAYDHLGNEGNHLQFHYKVPI